MAHAQWTPSAEEDLIEIAYWIAVQSQRPLTARRIVVEIKDKAGRYAATPRIGQRHPDLPDGWFYFRHKRWVIVYQPRDDGIDVLRVVDATRDFSRLFP